jgi:hypothetical protein
MILNAADLDSRRWQERELYRIHKVRLTLRPRVLDKPPHTSFQLSPRECLQEQASSLLNELLEFKLSKLAYSEIYARRLIMQQQTTLTTQHHTAPHRTTQPAHKPQVPQQCLSQ